MEAMLHAAGVETDFIRTAGETRLNTVLIETGTLRHTTICAEGLEPIAGDLTNLASRIGKSAPRSEAVAVCGSLPAGWPALAYRYLVDSAQVAGRPVVV